MERSCETTCQILQILVLVVCSCVLGCAPCVAQAQTKRSYRPSAMLFDVPALSLRSPIRLVAHGGASKKESRPEYVPFGRRERRMMVLGGVTSCFVAAGVATMAWFASAGVADVVVGALPPEDGFVERNVNYGLYIAPALACPLGTSFMVWKVGKAFGRDGLFRDAMLGAYVGLGAGLLLPGLLSLRVIPENQAERPIFSWVALSILLAPTSSAVFSMLEYKRSDRRQFARRIKSPTLAVIPAPGGGMAGVGFRF